VIFPDENPGKSGVRSSEEHSNDSRTALCRSGLSGAVRVSSEGTRFLPPALSQPLPNRAAGWHMYVRWCPRRAAWGWHHSDQKGDAVI